MKKKLKLVVILGVLTVAMISFAGCSKKETATVTSSNTNNSSTTDTSTASSSTTDSSTATTDSSTTGEKTFTLDELAKYDGKDGNSAYVAIDGKVYDVTNNKAWNNGEHQGNVAGKDLTDVISKAPHGTSVLSDLEQVGVLSE